MLCKAEELSTCFIPCCALSGWLALMLCFVRFASHEAKGGGTVVRACSVFTSISWAPAAKWTPSPTASMVTLLIKATAPVKQEMKLSLLVVMEDGVTIKQFIVPLHNHNSSRNTSWHNLYLYLFALPWAISDPSCSFWWAKRPTFWSLNQQQLVILLEEALLAICAPRQQILQFRLQGDLFINQVEI